MPQWALPLRDNRDVCDLLSLKGSICRGTNGIVCSIRQENWSLHKNDCNPPNRVRLDGITSQR